MILIRRFFSFFIDVNLLALFLITLDFLEGIFEVKLYFTDTLYFNFAAYVYLVFRDSLFKCGSIGKKILKLRITDMAGNNLSVGRKAFRNLFLLVYPIEIIVLLANKGRRLGDILVKSKVALCPSVEDKLPSPAV